MKKAEKREQLNAKELRDRVDELLHMVEKGKSFEIINHGRVVAELNPPSNKSAQIEEAEERRKKEIERLFADMDRLAEEIGKHWPEGVSAVDAIRDVRRDL